MEEEAVLLVAGVGRRGGAPQCCGAGMQLPAVRASRRRHRIGGGRLLPARTNVRAAAWLVLGLSLGSFPEWAAAAVARGTMKVPAGQGALLAKFCYDFQADGKIAGISDITLKSVSPPLGNIQVVLADDEGLNEAIDNQCGATALPHPKKWAFTVEASDKGYHQRVSITEKLIPRWWYVIVSDCDKMPRHVEYVVHMTNPNQGWEKEISMDRCGLFVLTVFLLAYVALAAGQSYAIRVQTAAARHPVRLMLAASTTAAAGGMLFVVVDELRFTMSGEGMLPSYIIGKFGKIFSKFLSMAVLMLLAHGRCIAKDMEDGDAFWIGKCLGPYFLACLGLEVWGESVQSHQYTGDFVYWSYIGGLVVLVDLSLFVVYLRALHRSYLAENAVEKQHFYRTWGIFYSAAFLVLPLATLCAQAAHPYRRMGIVTVLTNALHITVLASLVVGLWPDRTQPYFCIDGTELADTYGIKMDLLAQDHGSSNGGMNGAAGDRVQAQGREVYPATAPVAVEAEMESGS